MALQYLQQQMVVEMCPTEGCGAMTVMVQQHYERAKQTHERLHCSVGHTWRYVGENKEEQARREEREKAQREQARLNGIIAQERRVREEAERKAADAEVEKLKATREMQTTKRSLRHAVKTSAKLVSTKGRDKGRSHHKKKVAT